MSISAEPAPAGSGRQVAPNPPATSCVRRKTLVRRMRQRGPCPTAQPRIRLPTTFGFWTETAGGVAVGQTTNNVFEVRRASAAQRDRCLNWCLVKTSLQDLGGTL